jgi:hypothetical protein
MLSEYNPIKNEFWLERVRLEFETLDVVRFSKNGAGNSVRGALGWAMQETSREAYDRFFAPERKRGGGPSGFANPPRPFVLRAHHLEGTEYRPPQLFHVDLHLFLGTPAEAFIEAFGRVRFGRLRSASRERVSVSLEHAHASVQGVTLRFLTPTELKSAGGLADLPDFPVVFSRARDRLRTLSTAEPGLDFDRMAEQAAAVKLVSHRLTQHRRQRTSSRTGQTHPLTGFMGEATYSGEMDEFLPLLEVAYWTGIGRQTVWGKGVIDTVVRREAQTA